MKCVNNFFSGYNLKEYISLGLKFFSNRKIIFQFQLIISIHFLITINFNLRANGHFESDAMSIECADH